MKIVGVVAGVAAACAPMAAFNYWLDSWVDQQGQEEGNQSVRRALWLVEARIGPVVAAFDQLSSRGIDSCRPGNLEMMRQTVFVNPPVKEISIVDANGQTLCTDVGVAFGPRQLISTRPIAA